MENNELKDSPALNEKLLKLMPKLPEDNSNDDILYEIENKNEKTEILIQFLKNMKSLLTIQV